MSVETDALLAEGRIRITNLPAVERGAPPVYATVHQPRRLRKPRAGRTGLTPKPTNEKTRDLAGRGVARFDRLLGLGRSGPKPSRYDHIPIGMRARARAETRRQVKAARSGRRLSRKAA